MPTWTAVVAALSLAIIALAAIAVAVAGTLAARSARALLRKVEQLAGPAITDARQLVGTIKHEAEALVGASRDIRERIMRAADAAEDRLSDLNALATVVTDEVQDTVLDAAAALRGARRGFSLIEWGRRALRRRRRRR